MMSVLVGRTVSNVRNIRSNPISEKVKTEQNDGGQRKVHWQNQTINSNNQQPKANKSMETAW